MDISREEAAKSLLAELSNDDLHRLSAELRKFAEIRRKYSKWLSFAELPIQAGTRLP
jgi:hypothetical protein